MQIIFNGKTYNSLEEMPANERQAFDHMQQIFVDANGNGIPDFLEGDVFKNVMSAFGGNVNFSGKVYTDMDELPLEAKQKVQAAFAKLNQLGLVAAIPITPALNKDIPPFEPAFQPSKPLISQEPATQESGMRWMFIVGFLGVLLLCAVAFAVVMYLR